MDNPPPKVKKNYHQVKGHSGKITKENEGIKSLNSLISAINLISQTQPDAKVDYT